MREQETKNIYQVKLGIEPKTGLPKLTILFERDNIGQDKIFRNVIKYLKQEQRDIKQEGIEFNFKTKTTDKNVIIMFPEMLETFGILVTDIKTNKPYIDFEAVHDLLQTAIQS